MDYELMMNGNVRIGQLAPDFIAKTTMGEVALNDYKGKWLVLFSHPGDFTPVCTTEIIAFARANTYFEGINAYLLGLSIDSNASHLAWIYDIYIRTGLIIPFPIIADRSGEIARKYGMISSEVDNTSTVRNVFIIDTKGTVRAILVYPMNMGRNISEILRIVKTLQIADENNKLAPANWMPCDQMIVESPQTFTQLEERMDKIEKNKNGMNWYLSFMKPESCTIDVGLESDDLNRSKELYEKIGNNTNNEIKKDENREDISKKENQNKKSKTSKQFDKVNRYGRNSTIQWNNFK